MKVKITACGSKYYWYSKHIGEVFSVYESTPTNPYTNAKDTYRLSGSARGIYKHDCKIIDKYPTLSKGYRRV